MVSADYRINRTNSLEGAFEREDLSRQYRERDEAWENKVRLGYVNRDYRIGHPPNVLRVRTSSRQRLRGHAIGRVLQHFARPRADRGHDEHGTWFRNPDQFRRFDVADRNQNVLNARFNHGIGSDDGRERRLAGERRGVSGVGVWTQRPSATDRPLGGTRLAANGDNERVRASIRFMTGRQHQADVQPNACAMGTTTTSSATAGQTNATGVAPAPPAGTTLVGTEQVLESNWRSLCSTASATSPLFPVSRTWDESQKDHNTVAGSASATSSAA